MHAVGFIPARLHSTRLSRKLLLEETGRPLIQHTWEAACRARSLREVIVATDSPEIAAVVRGFGGRCEMTGEHASGTDRIAEAARRSCPDADVIVNVQGDEPEIDPLHIDRLVETLARHPGVPMATLAAPIHTAHERDSASCVKVVRARDGRALYFSRAPIPFCRDPADDPLSAPPFLQVAQSLSGAGDRHAASCGGAGHHPQHPGPSPLFRTNTHSPWLLHVGLYAFRREFLFRLTQLPPSPLERLEKLEQLRALEAGAMIQVAVVEHRAAGIDTPEDYAEFVARQRGRAA